MLDIKRKMLLTKDTIDFLFIFVGHKNKMLLEKDTMYFPLIYVGHKNEKNMR